MVAGSWSPEHGAQDGRFTRQGFRTFRAFRTRTELELLKRERKCLRIVAGAGFWPPPGRKRFGTGLGGRWIFRLFFLEVIFLQFSKIVVVAGSWLPEDDAQDGRFARQGFCAR